MPDHIRANQKIRYGRGEGQKTGEGDGKGTKGAKSRAGGFKGPRAYEGGQTPVTQLYPKHGFFNACVFLIGAP